MVRRNIIDVIIVYICGRGIYLWEGNKLFLCAFDRLEDVSEVFAEVCSMLAEVVGPCICFGPR